MFPLNLFIVNNFSSVFFPSSDTTFIVYSVLSSAIFLFIVTWFMSCVSLSTVTFALSFCDSTLISASVIVDLTFAI